MISLKILQSIIHSKDYRNKVLPHLKPEYFADPSERQVFELIAAYTDKYGQPPPSDALKIEIDNASGQNDRLAQESFNLAEKLEEYQEVHNEWMLTETEKFCVEGAEIIGMRNLLAIRDGKETKLTRTQVLDQIAEAHKITFNCNLGHNYLNDWEKRYEAYHTLESRIPFDIEFLNLVTDGGLKKKTLTCIAAPSGAGKTVFMCSCATAHMLMGKNVLYVSAEMSELSIAERYDMNQLDVSVNELRSMSKETMRKRMEAVQSKTIGNIIIREFPTGTVSVGHIEFLLDELRRKENFIPDVIYVDYLNIMCSAKIKLGSNINSYTLVKTIAEELRAMSIRHDVPVITATQLNRSGYENSDPEMSNTSESMGLVHTLDLYWALVPDEELSKKNQIMLKQLKNRYRDENQDKRFLIGMNKNRMKLFNVHKEEQQGFGNSQDKAKKQPEVKSAGLKQKLDPSVFDKFT